MRRYLGVHRLVRPKFLQLLTQQQGFVLDYGHLCSAITAELSSAASLHMALNGGQDTSTRLFFASCAVIMQLHQSAQAAQPPVNLWLPKHCSAPEVGDAEEWRNVLARGSPGLVGVEAAEDSLPKR